MTVDQILKLLEAGYNKEEIQALEQGTGSAPESKPDPKPEGKPKTPEKDPEPETKIDYARLSMELMKAAAGKDSGYSPDHKSKEEMAEDAILSMVR